MKKNRVQEYGVFSQFWEKKLKKKLLEKNILKHKYW